MATKLPGSDAFTNTPAYGNYPDLYCRTAPFGAVAETFSGYGLTPTVGQLHSGFFGVGGNVVADSFRAAGVKDQVSGLADKRLAAFVFRNLVTSAEVEAAVSFRADQQLGSAGTTPGDGFVCAVVGARIQGTPTLSSPAAVFTARADWPSGYYFLLANDASPTGFRFFLVKVASGTGAVLASTTATSQTAYALAIKYPTRISLKVEDDGAGGVDLSGYWTTSSAVRIGAWGFESGGGTTYPGETRLILTANDPSASTPHTGAGRCAFGVNTERGDGSTWGVANLVDYFEVSQVSDGTILVRDEWLRSEGRFTADVVASFATGKNLGQAWYGDRFFNDDNDRLDRNTESAGTDLARHAPSPTNTNEDGGGLFLSTRQAAAGDAQRRTVRMQWTANQAGMELGVWLRYGKTITNPTEGPSATDLAASSYAGHQGYLFLLTNTSGTSWTIELWRYTDTGRAKLAESSLGASGPFDETIDFEAVNDGGQVKLTATWTPGAFVWTNFANGASSGALGIPASVFDASSDRILSGFGEGYWIAGLTTQTVDVVSWTEETPTITGTGGGDNQPSVTLHDELYQSTGTLTIPATWPVALVDDGYRTVQAYTESLHLHTIPREAIRGRVWEVPLAGLDETDRDDLRAFWRAHRGPVRAFDWTEPLTGDAVKVLLLLPRLTTTKEGPDLYSSKVTLIEVR